MSGISWRARRVAVARAQGLGAGHAMLICIALGDEERQQQSVNQRIHPARSPCKAEAEG